MSFKDFSSGKAMPAKGKPGIEIKKPVVAGAAETPAASIGPMPKS